MHANTIKFKNFRIFAPSFGRGHAQAIENPASNFYLWDHNNVFAKHSTGEAIGSFLKSAFVDDSITSSAFTNTIATIKSDKLQRLITLYSEDDQNLIDVVLRTMQKNGDEKTEEKAKLLLFLYLLDSAFSVAVNSYNVDRYYDTSTQDKVLRQADDSFGQQTVRADFFEPITHKIQNILSHYKVRPGGDLEYIDFNYHEITDFSAPDLVTTLGLESLWKESILMEHTSHPKHKAHKSISSLGNETPVNDTAISVTKLSAEMFNDPQQAKDETENNDYADLFNDNDSNDDGLTEDTTDGNTTAPPEDKTPPPNEYENLFD